MITKTFKLTIATDTEEEMQKEEDHLSMIYGAEEQETGKWIYNESEHTLTCSACGKNRQVGCHYTPKERIKWMRYCSNCGAKMEVEQ